MESYIQGEVIGEKYEKYIRKACAKSDALLFVYFIDDEVEGHLEGIRIREKLRPYLIDTRELPAQWPRSKISGYTFELHIDIYRICPEIEAFLLSRNGIFDWGYPTHPEDMAFFKDGVCWFATTTHEKEAVFWASDEDEETFELFEKLDIPFDTYDWKYELYREDYTL